MFQPSVSPLAHLLFRNHLEMREIFSMLNASLDVIEPLDVSLTLANTRSRFTFDRDTGELEFSFVDGPGSYAVRIPTKMVDGQYGKIAVRFANGRFASPVHFVAFEDFAKLSVPKPFQKLHERVVKHLAQTLPAALIEAMGLAGNRSAKASVDASVAAQPDGAAEIPQPSQMVEDGANSATGSESGDVPSAQAPVVKDEHTWYVLPRHGAPDLRFKGKRLARVVSAPRGGRQNLFEVYQLESGKYLGVRVGLSWWVNEHDRTSTQVVEDKAQLVDFFEYSPLAKALYAQLGLEAVETLE